MARALWINPRVNWAFKGDMEDVDISKLKKMNLVSGKNRTNEGLVLQHEDLTFSMFQEGFAQKILMDTANLDKIG